MTDAPAPLPTQEPSRSSGGVRATLEAFISHDWVQWSILALIMINAVMMGLETSPAVMASAGELIHLLDKAILAVFVAEVAIRLYVSRLSFFKDPWSVFDFLVVGIALMPATGQFAILRALRVLRVLRVLTIVPSMRRVVGAMLGAVPGLFSIVMVLSLIYYVAAVMATNLFAKAFPEWFGNLGATLYTLFQVMTLESWSMGIVRPVMEVYPWSWIFFIPFIVVTSFAVLNLFIGIIVSAMQEEHDATASEERSAMRDEQDLILAEIRALREEVRQMGGKAGVSGNASTASAPAPGSST